MLTISNLDGLARSFRPTLVRGARTLVGPADAEDVVQDAFERALRSRTARSDGDPRPWMRRITRNVAYDRLRSRNRRLPIEPALDGAESAEHVVLRHADAETLESVLRTLPLEQRRTVVLHDLHGFSNAEIAALDGVPYNTVRTRLFRARRALRGKLGGLVA